MADNVETPTGATGSVATLVTGIVHDAQELLKQQIALFRAEVKEDMRKTREAAVALGAGVGVAVVGGLHLTLMLVFLLDWLVAGMPPREAGMPLWASFGIVGGLFTVVGLALYFRGKAKLESFNPLPDKTAEALKENVQWLTTNRT